MDALVKGGRKWVFVLEMLLHQHADSLGSVGKHMGPLIVGVVRCKVWNLGTCMQLAMLTQCTLPLDTQQCTTSALRVSLQLLTKNTIQETPCTDHHHRKRCLLPMQAL